MGTIAQKLTYLEDTKTAIGNAITAKGGSVTGKTFRQYATEISNLPSGGGGTVIEEVQTIPQTINSKNIIESVTIPTGYSLSTNAFTGCTSIKHLTVDSEIIPSHSFNSVKLDTLHIGPNVRAISTNGYNAFDSGVTTSITVDSNNQYFSVVNGCLMRSENNTYTLILGTPSGTIPTGTTEISWYAFSNLTLTNKNVVIPDSVTSFDDYPYRWTNIEGLTLNNTTSGEVPTFSQGYDDGNLKYLKIGAMYTSINKNYSYNSLETLVVDSNNATLDSRDNCNAVINTSTNTLIKGIKTSTIPNTVIAIDSNAFYRCTGLTSIVIPNNVTIIGSQAFYGCTGLTTVTIGSSTINNQAFYGCTGLTTVTIGSGVTSIAQGVFYNCTGLNSVTIEATTPPTLGNSASFTNTNNCPIYVPAASVDTYKAATNWTSLASRIQAIPEE